MKRFPINKYISILFCILLLAGQSIAADAFKNNLLKADFYKTSSGEIRINLYTSNPYSESVVVNKLNDNEYVILLPETSNSVVKKPSIEKFAEDIKDINIKTQTYLSNFKGYTKITISTNKPILITPQVLVLKNTAAAGKKNEKSNQTVKNNAQKPTQASKTAQKSPVQTANSTKKAEVKPVLKKTENKQSSASKNIQSKAVSKPQNTAVQKPVAKVKTISSQPIATQKAVSKPQPVKTAEKPPEQKPENTDTLANGTPPTPTPPAVPSAKAPTSPQTQQPVMPTVNNNSGFASFLNVYTIGATVLGLLLFLLLVARIRRGKVSQRSKSNPTDYMNNIENTSQEFDSKNANDILDSGGSLFSVAQENLNDSSWNDQAEFSSQEFSQQAAFEDRTFEEFSQAAVFDETQEDGTSDYIDSQDVHQEVDDLLASEDNSFSEEDFGQNPQFDLSQEPQYSSESPFEQNDSPEFESFENEYQQNFAPEFDSEFNFNTEAQPEFSPEPEIILEQALEQPQERPRPIPRIPTVPTENTVQETNDFTQAEDEMLLDELNELENQNSVQAEEPSIEELFAEDEEAFAEPMLTEEDLEGEIKIVEPFNQKFDESQIEKIKMPEKFEEVKTIALPEEEEAVEEINFEQQPAPQNIEKNDLQHFEDFETVAQPEEVVKSEFEIDDQRGFYMVDYLDFSILVGHIGEEIFVLKKFEEKVDDKLQARLNEKKGTTSNYMVKVGRFKALVDVKTQSMNLVIEL